MTFVDASVPLDSRRSHFLYGFGGYSRRLASSAGFYRRSLDARNIPEVYPLGFLPLIEPTVVDASGEGGIRGVVNRWNYDASGGFGRNTFAFEVADSLNVSLGPLVGRDKTRFDAGTLELGQFVGNIDVSRAFQIGALAGITRTSTVLAFRSYTKEELAATWDIGLS